MSLKIAPFNRSQTSKRVPISVPITLTIRELCDNCRAEDVMQ